jgi:Icc-related predicted phosphoesterase
MKILGLVDIHSKSESLEDLFAAVEDSDLALIAGDITHFGDYDEAKRILYPLINLGTPVYAVSGNCDNAGVDQFFKDSNLAIEGQPKIIKEVAILGMGGSLNCPSPTAHEHSEDEFWQSLSSDIKQIDFSAAKNLISVIHQPPINTVVDKSIMAGHVGSVAVRRFIEEFQPLLAFSGHIHEARGVDKIGATTLINPGPFLKGYYFTAEILDLSEIKVDLRQL